MTSLTGADYHRARAAMELERAAKAANSLTANLHRELAELHVRKAATMEDASAASLAEDRSGH